MKDIKYRAWHKHIDGWVMSPVLNIEFSSRSVNTAKGSFPHHMDDESLIILMQYTGYKERDAQDVYGEDIYEGDIVDCCRYEDESVYRIVIKDVRKVPSELFGSELHWRKIVGNIYQNPELIKHGS